MASDFSNIVAVKEAAGDMDQALRLLQNKPDDFLVISGDDMMALPMTLMGGAGVISVIGQGLPRDFSDMIRYALDSKSKEAAFLHFKLMNIIDYIFEEGNPAGIKSVFEALGLSTAAVRLPLVEATNDLKSRIQEFIKPYAGIHV